MKLDAPRQDAGGDPAFAPDAGISAIIGRDDVGRVKGLRPPVFGRAAEGKEGKK